MKTTDAIEAVRAEQERQLEELLRFCLGADRQGRCFPRLGWDPGLVRAYLAFHVRQGTACFVRHAGGVQASGPGALMAVGVAWQIREEFVRSPGFAVAPWNYHYNDPTGNCIYVDNLIATEPAGIGVLVSKLQWVWPEWRRMKVCSLRRGRLVVYERAERFFQAWERVTV